MNYYDLTHFSIYFCRQFFQSPCEKFVGVLEGCLRATQGTLPPTVGSRYWLALALLARPRATASKRDVTRHTGSTKNLFTAGRITHNSLRSLV